MARVERTIAAERDFEEIGYHIAVEQGYPETARKILQQISDQCSDLARLKDVAKLGTLSPDLGQECPIVFIQAMGNLVSVRRRRGGGASNRRWKPRLPQVEVG